MSSMYLQFTKWRQQPSPVCFEVIFLFAHPKFNGEPVTLKRMVKKFQNNLFRFLYLSHLVFIFNFFLFILKWAIVTVSKVVFFYFIRFVPNNTVANFLMYSSGAPRLANPISCENWANAGSAKRGTWPNNSWQTSLKMKAKKVSINKC